MPENETSGQETPRPTQKLDPKSDVLILTQKLRGPSTMRKSGMGLRGTTHWEAIMKKFSDGQKVTCKRIVPEDLNLTHRNLKKFPTGSTYVGTWNVLGMSGQGTYTFPHGGVTYKGGFDDGMFHGDGELQYECGAVIKGKWNKGKLLERHLFFADGLEYDEQEWTYCRPHDRRFTVEYDEGLEPAGTSYLTADQPTIPIPNGYYDVGDGFFDPITKLVYKYGDLSAIERAPPKREQQWITDNCRMMPDSSVGPCPFLYEKWVTPTVEAPTIPAPDIRCNTQIEIADKDEGPHRHAGKTMDRGHLFTSRIGLCSSTAFYSPGMAAFDNQTELKDSVHSILPHKKSILKVHSESLKVSQPEIISETIVVKAHQLSDSKVNVISQWGLADQSTIKKSISYGDESGIDMEEKQHGIRADSSFKVHKSASQHSHAKDQDQTYKSNTEADRHVAGNIKAKSSSVKPELLFKLPINTTSLSHSQSGYKKEIAPDPERYEIKPESSSEMPISVPNLQLNNYKQETALDPMTHISNTEADHVERSQMKPESSVKISTPQLTRQSEYEQKTIVHAQEPETNKSLINAQTSEKTT